MPVPAFGFSAGDFVSAISLLNTVRKALRDSGGSQDELQAVLQDLHQVEVNLKYLHEGEWGKGSDLSHVNAVRGVALSTSEPLIRLLDELRVAQKTMSCERHNLKNHLKSNAKRGQWAVLLKDEVSRFRQSIMANLMALNLLLAMSLRWVQIIHGWVYHRPLELAAQE